MSQADADTAHRERTAQMIRLAELMAAGHPADADPVQAETDAQYRALTELRAVSAEDYRAIGRSIVDNETGAPHTRPSLPAWPRTSATPSRPTPAPG